MALVPPIDDSPEAVRAVLAPLRNDFSIAVHSCGNAFAVGAIIRVAHSFLAREILILGGEPHYEKASMGMEKYENLVRLPSEEDFFAHVEGRPIWAIEKDLARTSLHEVQAFPDDVVLVFGSERAGLPAPFVERAQEVIGIPMYGVNHSLPVAVAAGIVMNEWARQKHAGRRI
jgi:tRNA G18 (ribose-2'-O)-methylase SpoU